MLKRIRLIRIITFSVLGVMAVSANARPDLNAFLNKRADTVPSMVAQLKSDKVVMNRYTRHFAMTPSEVVQYFKSLTPATIKTNGIYTIYSVPEGGTIKGRIASLKKGTKVLVDSTGTPVIVVKCGNPLTRGPKTPEIANALTPELIASVETTLDEVAEPVVQIPIVMEPTYYALMPADPEVPTLTEVVETKGQSDIPVFVGSSSTPWGALVPLGGLVSLIDRNSSVPEPATVTVVAVGAVALLARRRRKNG